jgi:HK97 family phage portal protein
MNFFSRFKSLLGGYPSGSFMWPGMTASSTLSKKQMLLEYQGVVYAVVTKIADNFAKIDLQVQDKNQANPKPLAKHELLDLLKKPNPMQSQYQFLRLHQIYMGLVGENYWYTAPGKLTGKPTMFLQIRPDMMQVVVDPKDDYGFVSGYVMTKPNGQKVPFDLNEILHFKLPNPYNPYYGLGPLQAGYIRVQTEKFASEFTANSILNSGRPSGILNFKGKIQKDEFDQIKKRFKQEYTGTKNTGKTLMVNGAEALDYQKLGMELGEVALKELKDLCRDDIMMMWGVSKTMLGISEGVTLNNARDSREVFDENVIDPKRFEFVDHLDSFLMPIYGGNKELTYVNKKQYTLKELQDEWTAGHNKWLRTNDVIRERNKFMGSELKEDPAGETFYVPLNLVPLSDDPPAPPVVNPSNDNPPPKDQPKSKPPKKDPAAEKNVKKKVNRTPETIEQYRIAHYKIQAKFQRKFQVGMQQVFLSMEKEILDRNKTKALEQWFYDKKNALKLAVSLLSPVYQEEMLQEAQLALEFTGDPDTNFELDQRVNNFISARMNRFMGDTSTDLTALLTETITEGIRDGDNIDKMRKRVQAVFETTRARAERIARTETSAASNQAAIEAYRQSPVVSAKEFYAQPDACPFCASMNGKVIGIDENYFNVGQSLTLPDGSKMNFNYDDVSAPPLHPNCECALLPVYLKN